MKSPSRTNPELIEEISILKQRIEELEQSESERKQAQEALQQSEEKYRRIIETSQEGIVIRDENFKFTYVNERFAEMLGYSQEELIGIDPVQLNFKEDMPERLERHERHRQGIAEPFERRFRRKDGSAVWTHISMTPMLDEAGRFKGAFAMHTDITQRKQAQEALQQSEEKYRRIIETSQEGIDIVDENFKLTFVNERFAEMLGYSPEEIIGKDPTSFTFEEDKAEISDRRTRRRRGISEPYERRFRRKDGSAVWTHTSMTPMMDKNGRFKGAFAMHTDITQRKQAQEALQQSEEKFRNIFENVVEGISQTTPEGRFLTVNPALARMYGYSSPEEIIEAVTDIGRQFYVNPNERDKFHRIVQEKGVARGFELQMKRKDGSTFWASLNARPVYDENGSILYYEGTTEDITSRKLSEEKLRKTLAGTIQVMSLTVETRDPYTAGHQKKVSNLARNIAQEMGLSNDTVDTIRMAGVIHDLGKISVPTEILSKPTNLTDIEFSLIKIHSQAGYDILKEAELPYPIAEIVLQHHERLDGSGYPQGLKNDQILLESQIIAVADVVEAIASYRPYRPAKGIEAALEEIEKNKGILYNKKVVEICLRLFRKKGFKLEGT